MQRIQSIRKAEKTYHDHFYENNTLFEKGSWLYKPVQTVLDLIPNFTNQENVTLLDLGCGVGRNSIPLAKAIQPNNGKVVCVDLLESALIGLEQYSKQHDVAQTVELVKTDIGAYNIKPNTFDGIIVVSALEHVKSEQTLYDVLKQMEAGTKRHGLNCLIVNSEVEEYDLVTNEQLVPQFEVNMKTETMIERLNIVYENWEMVKKEIKKLTYEIDRDGRNVLLKTNAITYVVKKQ